MDTSANHVYEQTKAVLGTKSIETSEIAPETWVRVLEDVFAHWRIGEAEVVFKPIADFTDGKSPFVEVFIPRGTIEFEKGLAITTPVHLSPIDQKRVGEEPHSLIVRRNLLLIRPENDVLCLKWALWTISYVASKPGERKVVQSSVGYVDRERLLRIFKENPRCPDFFLNIGTDIMLHAEDLRNRAHRLGMVSQWIRDIRERVKR